MLFSKPGLPLKIAMSLAICLSSTSAMASSAACQAGEPGCVLPVRDPAPAPAPVTSSYVDDDDGFGIGLLPILGLLAVAGAILYFTVLDDDGDEDPISP